MKTEIFFQSGKRMNLFEKSGTVSLQKECLPFLFSCSEVLVILQRSFIPASLEVVG